MQMELYPIGVFSSLDKNIDLEMMLLISLLSCLVTEDFLMGPLPRRYGLRLLNHVVNRKYQKGDDMSLVATSGATELSCESYRCWVTATSGDRVRPFSSYQSNSREGESCTLVNSHEPNLYRCDILCSFESDKDSVRVDLVNDFELTLTNLSTRATVAYCSCVFSL